MSKNLHTISKSRKVINNIICSFIPSRKLRNKIRLGKEIKYFNKNMPKMLSTLETVKMLQNGYSITRYGDGEFGYIVNAPESDKLKQRMVDILKNNKVYKLLIGIPNCAETNFESSGYVRAINYCISMGIFNNSRNGIKYGNSLITRLRGIKICPLEEYLKIWNGRNVVFVRSPTGKFVLDNRLFGNINQKYFIDIPANNAFNEYDRIFNDCKNYPKNYLFLISGGFMATVLAHDLAELGYQALDIGHLTICYIEYLDGAMAPDYYQNNSLKGKVYKLLKKIRLKI